VCKPLYDNGTKLGQGGEGEVRRVEWNGAAYAIKCLEGPLALPKEKIYIRALGHSTWIQLPLSDGFYFGGG